LVLAVNVHGSSGFGQAFQDAVTGDWGGAPQLDLMLGLRWLVHASPWASMVDAARVVAAGASFGGYSINWLNGHTRLLQGLVCHDGIFDSATAAFTTEEAWFMQWEFGGLPGQGGGGAAAGEDARRVKEGAAVSAYPALASAAQV
jgi:dipeptidyl aminopeptidase/acylaminoacyl peptidase